MFTPGELFLFCATAPLWAAERYSPFTRRRLPWRVSRLTGALASALAQAIAAKTPAVLPTGEDVSRHYDFRALVRRQPAEVFGVVPLGDRESIDARAMPRQHLTLWEIDEWIHTPSKGRLFAWLPLDEVGGRLAAIPSRVGGCAIDPRMCGMFVSSPQYFTRIHFDWAHGVLAQIHGRKRVTLVAPRASRHLYLNSPFSTPVPRYATKLPNRIADCTAKFPALANVHIEQVVLGPGETLYIPPFWWHEVETLEPSASLAIRYGVPWHASLSPRAFELLALRVRYGILHKAAELLVENDVAHMLQQQPGGRGH